MGFFRRGPNFLYQRQAGILGSRLSWSMPWTSTSGSPVPAFGPIQARRYRHCELDPARARI